MGVLKFKIGDMVRTTNKCPNYKYSFHFGRICKINRYDDKIIYHVIFEEGYRDYYDAKDLKSIVFCPKN